MRKNESENEIKNDMVEIPTFEDLEVGLGEKIDKDPNEAMKLVRCIITCNNKNKTAYTGDIFCAGNGSMPPVKKFVQFGTPYHVPQIILNSIKEKKYNVFHKERLAGGGTKTVAKEVPEYNIQILDPLTPEEIESIKKKQLAEGLNNED